MKVPMQDRMDRCWAYAGHQFLSIRSSATCRDLNESPRVGRKLAHLDLNKD